MGRWALFHRSSVTSSFGLAVILLWLVLISPGISYAQFIEPILIRSGSHDGYGRLVLQFAQSPNYEAEIIGDQLILRFDRPFNANIDGVIAPVGRYVSDVLFDADQNAIAFVLRDAFDVRAFKAGSSVVIDILDFAEPEPAAPPVDQQAPEPPPTPTTQATASGELLSVRVGRHPTYRRVVFDWPSRVDYQITPTDTGVDIDFTAPARINIASLNRRLPPGIRASVSGTNPLRLSIAYPQGTGLRHFLSGPKMVLDLIQNRQSATSTQSAPPPDPTSPTQASSTPSTQASPTPSPETAAGAGAKSDSSPVAATKAPADGAGKTSRQAEAPTQLIPTDLAPKTNTGTVNVRVTQTPEYLNLGFEFGGPTKAALWQRAGFIWLMFDRLVTLGLDQIRSDDVAVIGIMEQTDNEFATVARFTVADGVAPIMSFDDESGTWNLRLQPGDILPVERIGPTINLDEDTRAHLYIPADGAAEVIPVFDPEAGDFLQVTPIPQAASGIEFPLVYPEFNLLTTHQGVVVAPVADGINVSADGSGVMISAPEGLQVSPEGAVLLVSATSKRSSGTKMANPDLIYELEDWARGGLNDFSVELRRLRRAILEQASREDGDRNKARLDIARLYFANGFGPEANAILKVMEHDDPQLAQDLDFIALRGGVNHLAGNHEQAERDLAHPMLDGLKEVQLWRAIAASGAGSPARAARDLLASADLLEIYPEQILLRVGPLLAETALLANNPQGGQEIIDLLLEQDMPEVKHMDIMYLQGLLQQDVGEFDAALASWDEVIEGRNRKARAHAIADRTELLLQLTRLTPQEAIEQLDRLRYAWRGDDFELNLLRRLGQLYIANNDYRNGLNTLRQAATFFPTHPDNAAITQQMNDSFKNLYLEDGADKLLPITAIALYDEFKELTPAGEEGDEMIRRLADRLMAVDLLSRAAELLEHQVAFRLEGEEKARIGARLAYVYLRDNKPAETLRVLEASDEPVSDPDLIRQRQHLQAQALIGLDRKDEAIDLLIDDFSEDAERLRVEVFHEQSNWAEKALALERLVGEPAADIDTFVADQARNVLDWASALVLSGEERQLQRVRRMFGMLMAQTPFKDAFRLITSPNEQGLPDYRSLSHKLREAESFKSFMDIYRERLENGTLSTIN